VPIQIDQRWTLSMVEDRAEPRIVGEALAHVFFASGCDHEQRRPVVRIAEHPVRDSGAKSSLAVLFDGLPTIEAGVPHALSAAQSSGDLPPITAVYVESIESSAKRRPSRQNSLTRPDILQRFIDEAATFIAGHANVYVNPSRRIAVGHSLGVIASLYVAAERPRFCLRVVAERVGDGLFERQRAPL
jgi:enterochelin esterase-like enzyme